MEYNCLRNLLRATSLLALLAIFACGSALAQLDQGTITGVVQDPSSAVLAAAQVTLISDDTGLARKTESDAAGIYIFSPLKIGNYSITASAQGFKQTTQEHVHLDVGARLNVVITLTPGAASETVTVSTAPPVLETQSASVGQVLSTSTINTTALNGRNWVYIAQLTAGVVPAEGSRGAGTGDFEANGQGAGQNNFVLDGVDNNSSASDELGGSSYVVRPPPDALAEFKISTNAYSAEYGHSAGAVVNASIKSGTNQIHGDLWEYFRNNVLDARDFDALTVPRYNQNQFGATLGLPILRNKLFFFADGEANRIVFGETYVESVPTAKMRQGNFTELLSPGLTGSPQPIQLYESGGTVPVSCNGQNNVYCPSQLDPVALNILNLYPSPNANGGRVYNNYNLTSNATDNRWAWDARMDWNASTKDQSFVRFTYSNEPDFYPQPLGNILNGGNFQSSGNSFIKGEDFVLSETHIFSPALINEFRFGYQYSHYRYSSVDSNVDNSTALGLGGIPSNPGAMGLPTTNVTGISRFGSVPYYTADEYQNTYQVLDNVTKIAGNHSVKVGVQYQNMRFTTLEPSYPNGGYTFSGTYSSLPGVSYTGYGVADFVTNQINSSTISNTANQANSRWYLAAYGQDDWRVTAKLTLNLGLRYEIFEPMKENSGRQANFTPNYSSLGIGTGSATYYYSALQKNATLAPSFLNALAQDNVNLAYVGYPALAHAQGANFSPRVGIAYQLDPKTVVRAGFGIFFGGLENLGGTPMLVDAYPFQFASTFTSPNCTLGNCPTNGFTLETGFSQQIAAGLLNDVVRPAVEGAPNVIPTPYVMAENLTAQRAFSNTMSASVGYVGSLGRHVLNFISTNPAEALLNPGNNSQFVRPFPQFSNGSYMADSAVSSYNALQAKLEKQNANGLNFLATYTWSHSMDDAPSALGSTGDAGYRNTALVPIALDYANSPWDTRHRVTLNGLYELPFGTGRSHLNHAGFANIIAGGWSTSLTFVAQTGNPFTVTPDITTASGGNSRGILIRNPSTAGGSPDPSNPSVTCAQKTRNRVNWYNPCAFANPLRGSLISPGPNSGNPNQPQPGYAYPQYVTNPILVQRFLGGQRNQIMGPGYERINMSIFKSFATFREQQLQFRTDVFNLFNTPAYGDPSVATTASNGGQITSPRFFQNFTPDARFFQFSLKYLF
jgi:outer membrane receptor protein involved in Fe transport